MVWDSRSSETFELPVPGTAMLAPAARGCAAAGVFAAAGAAAAAVTGAAPPPQAMIFFRMFPRSSAVSGRKPLMRGRSI